MITIAAASLVAPHFSAAQERGPIQSPEPVLIELFTSQGCSSCPPADRLAARLASEPDLVILSRPVTYWDRLGWKDTLAREANTDLQRAYARRGLGGYNGVYTPQTVVNGQLGEVGSDERALRQQVRTVSGRHIAAIRATKVDGSGFAIGLAGRSAATAELLLVGVSTRQRIAIGRGENRGRAIDYTNVVIDERRLATWSGGSASHPIRDEQFNMAGADRYALILREQGGGPVLAARWLD